MTVKNSTIQIEKENIMDDISTEQESQEVDQNKLENLRKKLNMASKIIAKKQWMCSQGLFTTVYIFNTPPKKSSIRL